MYDLKEIQVHNSDVKTHVLKPNIIFQIRYFSFDLYQFR